MRTFANSRGLKPVLRGKELCRSSRRPSESPCSCRSAVPSKGHHFGSMPVFPRVARNPGESVPAEEVVTADDTGPTPAAPTPAPAPPVSPPTPPPPRACSVSSGPSYSPTGTIPVTASGGRKRASFSLAASFASAAGTPPSCCEVRQEIKWDDAFHTWNGGPPHSGFPSSASANTWIEDRDTADKRYGHRSGPHSDPVSGCGDEYKSGSTQDQANGDTYCGRDTPGGPDTMTGQFQFRLKVIDTCNASSVKATSSVITINW